MVLLEKNNTLYSDAFNDKFNVETLTTHTRVRLVG